MRNYSTLENQEHIVVKAVTAHYCALKKNKSKLRKSLLDNPIVCQNGWKFGWFDELMDVENLVVY